MSKDRSDADARFASIEDGRASRESPGLERPSTTSMMSGRATPRLPRRSFLAWSAAAAPGIQCACIHAAGKPACDRCHDADVGVISPERVVVMTDRPASGPTSRVVEPLKERFGLAPEKLGRVCRLAGVMCDYYRVPHALSAWAAAMARRESLASTGLPSLGVGCFHEFQDSVRLQLAASPVDWWLFLFPRGIDWGSGEPVYALIGHVFPPDHGDLVGFKLMTYCVTSRAAVRIGESATNWARVAKLDREGAARLVNRAVQAVAQQRFDGGRTER